MRKDFFVHLAFLVSFLILATVIKGWIDLAYWPFWVGMIIGTILPDVDHFIYVYLLSPTDLTSQRVSHALSKREIWNSISLLYDTRRERSKLIFHTAWFQVLFVALAFFVSTSSGSTIGLGLVLAFSLHILVDQLVDLVETRNLDSWFRGFFLSIQMDTKRYWIYFLIMLILTLLICFVF